MAHDPHRGPLVYLRVYAGELQKRQVLYNGFSELPLYARKSRRVHISLAPNLPHPSTSATPETSDGRACSPTAGRPSATSSPRSFDEGLELSQPTTGATDPWPWLPSTQAGEGCEWCRDDGRLDKNSLKIDKQSPGAAEWMYQW